jgi:hypothetical protein
MALWEYKVITSGIHGFVTPALLESYLNTLGKDEWEIVNYQPSLANPLAFTGLVRRPAQRDWLPPAAAVISAPPLQQPHTPDHKPHNGSANPLHPESAKPETPVPSVSADPAHETTASPASASEIVPPPAGTMRPIRDTERDRDPEALAEDDNDDGNVSDAAGDDDEWDSINNDDLPTFFDALKPHMRTNLKGPGQSVGVDYLAKRWELRETEILGALKECGLTIPETEDAEPEYFEFEDDLFWVNRNNRGQYFINTREKPRPIFRTVPATPLSSDDPAYAELAAERAAEKARIEKRNAEHAAQQAAAAARAEEAARRRAEAQAAKDNAETHSAASRQPSADRQSAAESTPAAPAVTSSAPEIAPPPGDAPFLDRIRPMMRRNRHGPGSSGSIGFLARALEITDADLADQLIELGLRIPALPGEKPTFVEIGATLYWLNKDIRGNIWINARENKTAPRKPDWPPTAAPTVAATTTTTTATAATTDTPADATQAAKPASDKIPQEHPTFPQEQPSLTPSLPSPSLPPPSLPPPFFPHSLLPSPLPPSPLATVRPLLKTNKRGSGVSGEVGYLARALDQNETEFVATLTGAGLVVPPDAGTKPTFVEHEGEIFWFNFYEKDGATSIWLNAKPAKAKKKSDRAPRIRSKNKPSKSAEPDQPAKTDQPVG